MPGPRNKEAGAAGFTGVLDSLAGVRIGEPARVHAGGDGGQRQAVHH